MTGTASSARFGKHAGLSVLLIVVYLVGTLLSPVLGLVIGLATIIHAHVAGFRTTRNVLIVLFILAIAGFALFGIGGRVEGGLID